MRIVHEPSFNGRSEIHCFEHCDEIGIHNSISTRDSHIMIRTCIDVDADHVASAYMQYSSN